MRCSDVKLLVGEEEGEVLEAEGFRVDGRERGGGLGRRWGEARR